MMYMVYNQDANSWSSYPKLPVAVFTEEAEAEKFAKKQPGYGFNVDWFVKSVPLNPDVS
jgi:hypothetical protein